MPVPGFLAATISREIVGAGGDLRAVTTDFSNTCFISRERLEVVLVDRVREHRLELADAVDEVLELERLGREARVGAVQVAREREVLLDDRRAERHRREAPRSSRACGRRSRRACRSARAARASTLRPTRSDGVGYCDVHCSTVTSSPAAATAASSSAHDDIPDVRSTGLPVAAAARTSSRFVTSPEPIL